MRLCTIKRHNGNKYMHVCIEYMELRVILVPMANKDPLGSRKHFRMRKFINSLIHTFGLLSSSVDDIPLSKQDYDEESVVKHIAGVKLKDCHVQVIKLMQTFSIDFKKTLVYQIFLYLWCSACFHKSKVMLCCSLF